MRSYKTPLRSEGYSPYFNGYRRAISAKNPSITTEDRDLSQ